jgi:phosphoribosylamine--glycine ligase
MSDPINVAIIGSGAREHALAWRLSQSPTLGRLWAIPGNPGIAQVAACANVPIADHDAVARFCRDQDITFVIVGPEDPLAEGIADDLLKAGLRVFGPKKAAARLEADKAFAKELMRQVAVPTAEARTFSDPTAAELFVKRRGVPCVVKAAGLAKGKGVSVCFREQDALEAIDAAMRGGAFGEAGRTVVVEEYLEGVECSVLALVDRRDLLVLELCQDHKPVGEGNTGPMTGGMGAFSPARTVSEQMLRGIEAEILVPIIDGLARDGVEYRGCLYAGLMITAAGPKVLEFNARFGDPETQPLMMRWRGDLLAVLLAVAEGRLAEVVEMVDWDPRTAVTVVLASGGYPGKYLTGMPISGIERAATIRDVQIFHGGTATRDGRLVTNGGRVLSVTALGAGLAEARLKAYEAVSQVSFEGMHFRRDIGERAEVSPFVGSR